MLLPALLTAASAEYVIALPAHMRAGTLIRSDSLRFRRSGRNWRAHRLSMQPKRVRLWRRIPVLRAKTTARHGTKNHPPDALMRHDSDDGQGAIRSPRHLPQWWQGRYSITLFLAKRLHVMLAGGHSGLLICESEFRTWLDVEVQTKIQNLKSKISIPQRDCAGFTPASPVSQPRHDTRPLRQTTL